MILSAESKSATMPALNAHKHQAHEQQSGHSRTFGKHVQHQFSEPNSASEYMSQLATGCVTCHTCHSCMTDFRPILGNPVEVTHVTSPGHIILSDKSHSSEGSSEGNHLESLHNYNFYSVFHKHIYQGNVERRT